MLHATDLKLKEQDQLADALGRPSLALCPDANLAVPVSATLWMLAATCCNTLLQVRPLLGKLPGRSALLSHACVHASFSRKDYLACVYNLTRYVVPENRRRLALGCSAMQHWEQL